MDNSYLSNQKDKAYDTCNYFNTKMIVSVLKICFVLAIILLISLIFDNDIFDIIALIYTLLSIYRVYNIIDNYTYILNDIKNTLNLEPIYYQFSFNKNSDSIFKGLVNYGK